jgi:SAM-dependent methyltransferase
MDSWKFYHITHEDHIVMNPTSEEKLGKVVEFLQLQPGSRAIDFGCGKGEFLIRLAEVYNVVGMGVDMSPYCVADARRQHQERVPFAALTFEQADGASIDVAMESVSLASCIGATWIFGGYKQTLQALTTMTIKGGWIVVGEPHWMCEPAAEYLEAARLRREHFGTRSENAAAAELFGLHLAYTFLSSHEDWEHYERLQWDAAERYASKHDGDPDVPELSQRVMRQKAAYSKWGRDTLGWALYMFRKAH